MKKLFKILGVAALIIITAMILTPIIAGVITGLIS